MKKAISILLALCCAAFSVNIAIAQDNTYTKGDFIYDTNTNEIVAYCGKGGTVIIPENSVVSTTDLKFSSRGLKSETEGSGETFVPVSKFICSENVTIKGDLGLGLYNLIEEIEFRNTADLIPASNLSFHDCEKLEKLVLPENLTKIPNQMCSNCYSLKEIYIPDTVQEIGKEAFSSCKSLTEMILPNELVKVGDKAFNGCNSIKKLYIPKNVDPLSIYIPYSAETIEFENQPEYTVDFYRHFIRTKWFEDKVIPSLKTEFLTADGYLFKYLGNSENVTVPNDVKVIADAAFAGSNVEKIVLPEGLTTIEEVAFKECTNLKEVIIPKSVELLEFGAFSECDSLEKVVIEGSPVLEENLFAYCPLLTKENVIIKGEFKPADKYSDPFEFMGTVFATPIPNDTVVDLKPSTTPKPSATPQPTETAKPTVEPTTTPVPEVLTVESGGEITVKVNDKAVVFPDAKPFLDDNGRTQVPVRAVSEMLNAKVDWQQDSATAVITKGNGDTVKIKLNSNVMTINEKSVQMDTAATLKDNRTFIPVRFVAEALGLTVNWVE